MAGISVRKRECGCHFVVHTGNMPLWLHSRMQTGVTRSCATPGWSQGPAGCQGRRRTQETVGWTEGEEPLGLIPTRPSQFSHSVVSDSATPWTAACQASLSIANSQSLLKLMSIESVMPSNHLILCCPLLLLPSIFPSIRVFSNASVLHIR